MKIKWSIYSLIIAAFTFLAGCSNKLLVLDPKGPQARTQADVIMISIWTMAFIVLVVIALFVFMIYKYRASKQSVDYEPPHIEGSTWVELLCVGIPVLIVAYLSVISVQSNYKVEARPEGYEHREPLIIYAFSSNWKWHFSYPKENIETVNYLYIPTGRPLEFKLYSYGPITSFWIPQLGGQKYAMADMVTTLHLAADVPGEYMGRNANFSGKGFAENTFNVKAVTEAEFGKWIDEVRNTAEPLQEDKFEQLLKPGHVGQYTFTGTHLPFRPAPEGEHHHQTLNLQQDSDHHE
ncbi:cytochrome aa3 quinol oxidase subunit II [Brevibacillus borstelensis]|uniref:cytochrome aa3 quinol oxidase subunit II n=1 Tax=Brevibacillus borstelensis TaxID=45462 RepID=UPI0030BCC645